MNNNNSTSKLTWLDRAFLFVLAIICIASIADLFFVSHHHGQTPTPAAQAKYLPRDDVFSTSVGSLLQHIEQVMVNGEYRYEFKCAGWEQGVISRPVQELLITFDPNQKEPSPRCWISQSRTERKITALYLEFTNQAQFQSMLTYSSVPPR